MRESPTHLQAPPIQERNCLPKTANGTEVETPSSDFEPPAGSGGNFDAMEHATDEEECMEEEEGYQTE